MNTVSAAADRALEAYFELLKRSLINEPGIDQELRLNHALACGREGRLPDPLVLRDIRHVEAEAYAKAIERRRTGHLWVEGTRGDWPFTAIGRVRLDHLQACMDELRREGIAGDFLEAGVWRGGACMFMRAWAKMYDEQRLVWAADSFEGLPPSTHAADQGFELSAISELAIDLEHVKENFRLFDLLDEGVRFLPGWFSETLATAPVDRLALLRIDADMYESTMDVLRHLYPKLQSGGWLIVDDYGVFPPCRHAVEAYRLRHGITEPIEAVDYTCIAWRKA